MGRKAMTEEHKQKIVEAREKALLEKERNKVHFEVDKFTVESYEYGWRVYETGTVDHKFFANIIGVGRHLLSEKLRKSGIKQVEEFTEAVKVAEQNIINALEGLNL